ncbi:hypothetical protein MRB53_039011 [Persea americana]|nr:hypothetical protein MRB53_039011 [Persea americana]
MFRSAARADRTTFWRGCEVQAAMDGMGTQDTSRKEEMQGRRAHDALEFRHDFDIGIAQEDHQSTPSRSSTAPVVRVTFVLYHDFSLVS